MPASLSPKMPHCKRSQHPRDGGDRQADAEEAERGSETDIEHQRRTCDTAVAYFSNCSLEFTARQAASCADWTIGAFVCNRTTSFEKPFGNKRALTSALTPCKAE